MLQALSENMLQALNVVFSASITLEYSPQIWRQANVIFIPKIGRPSYTEPGSFRPISLTSFVIQCLEKLVYWQINDTALTETPYSADQVAFRSGCSTENAISAVTDIIERSTLRRRFTLGVFLDVAAAFDNISIDSIMKAMRKRKIDPNIIAWYDQYIRNRTCSTEIKGIRLV
jgi:retron-type reverse transcriptase